MNRRVDQALALAERYIRRQRQQKNRLRKGYISGRFRHYLPDGSLDRAAMDKELADEWRVELLLLKFNIIPYPPLRLSVAWEREMPSIEDEQFLAMDLEILGGYTPGFDLAFMRPGWNRVLNEWNPASEGATREHARAEGEGLIIVDPDNDRDAERQLMRLAGVEE